MIETRPFSVEAIDIVDESSGKDLSHPYYRITCADWVNILPITEDGKAVLIKQPRAGTLKTTLEIPGGEVNQGERDTTMAAYREMEEETGYFSRKIIPLGSISPNPAIMTNRLHMFLALEASLNPNRKHFPDTSESIEVELCDWTELDGLIRTGQLNSALAGLTVMLAFKYLKT
jgi:8-oxo-dGTP pyrophosphatase MutT (NUDIX family)